MLARWTRVDAVMMEAHESELGCQNCNKTYYIEKIGTFLWWQHQTKVFCTILFVGGLFLVIYDITSMLHVANSMQSRVVGVCHVVSIK